MTYKQDRQCTYNVTLRRVRITTWMCICNRSYPTCNWHAPYYVLICGLSGCTIFYHEFRKKYDCTWNVFWFSQQRLTELFIILQRIQRDSVIHVNSFLCKVPHTFVGFNETWIFLTDLRKILKCQVSRKFVQWEPSGIRRTDWRTIWRC